MPSCIAVNIKRSDRTDRSISVAMGRIFNVALLLTGAATSAEHAVIEALSSLDPETVTAEALLRATIAMSVRHAEIYDAEFNNPEADYPALPIELRNVLEMEPALRQCFVLRVLLGLPVEVCASLLRLNKCQIAANVCVAMQSLANTRENEQWTAKHASFESYSRPLSSESRDSI